MRRAFQLGNGLPQLRSPRPSGTGTWTIGTTLATVSLATPEACAGRDTYMQASPLAPVPEPHHTVVGGACGQQVVAVCLQAV